MNIRHSQRAPTFSSSLKKDLGNLFEQLTHLLGVIHSFKGVIGWSKKTSKNALMVITGGQWE